VCSIESFPSDSNSEEIRNKSKLEVPDGPVEDYCISYPTDTDAAFNNRRNDEQKGTFKILKDKGLKVTNYIDWA
jgi:hypothetical protein